MKKLLLTAAAAVMTMTASAGTLFSAPFTDGSDAGFTLGSTSDPLTVWVLNNYGLVASGYESATQTRYTVDSRAVSPVIDLTAASDATLSFEWAGNYFTNQDNMKSRVSVAAREEGAADWTALNVPEWPLGNNWNFVASGDISLKAYAGKKVQISFQYTSGGESTNTGTLEVKNLTITDGAAVVPDQNVVKLSFQNLTANEVEGKWADTVYKDDGSVSSWGHWQPITKVVVDGYNFTFVNSGDKTDAAVYTSASNGTTLRLYNNISMTMTAPAGVKMYGVDFTAYSGDAQQVLASTGTIDSSDIKNIHWTSAEGVNEVTFTFSAKIQLTGASVYTDAGSVIAPPTAGKTFKLSVNDAEEIDGTFVEEKPAEGDGYPTAAHFENLKSFYIGDYYFTCESTAKSQPALFLAMSTSTTGNKNVRLYGDATLNVYAPEGVKITKLVFDCSNFGTGFTAPTANEGTCTTDGTKTVTWEYPAGMELVQINSTANWRWYNVEVTTNGSSLVKEVQAAPVVLVANGCIIAPEGAEVYSLNGMRVGTDNLAKGVYVVRVGEKAVKVLVK